MSTYNPIDTKKDLGIISFLAVVDKVILNIKDCVDITKESKAALKLEEIDKSLTLIKDDGGKEKNPMQIGAIYWKIDDVIERRDYAYPFDKNRITYPIEGETVVIIQIGNEFFWLPYTVSAIFPNYRESKTITNRANPVKRENSSNSANQAELAKIAAGGVPNTDKSENKTYNNKTDYKINPNIKYLQPYPGDSIISGRAGSTIRLSQFCRTTGKITPSILISNNQNNDTLNKPVGFLATEDINKDGSSIHITSGETIVPFEFTNAKANVPAWGTLPTSDKLKGNQIYLNSDRVILSSKQSDFIIFGKGHTGVISGDRYTIDAAKDIYVHSDDSIKIQSAGKDVRILTDTGKIYIGSTNSQNSGTPLKQPMVKGDELVKILSEVLEEMAKQVFATGSGPTGTGPANAASFRLIKSKLNTILSQTNFLS